MAIYYLNLKIGKQKCNKHYEYINREGSYKNYNKGEDFIYSESKNLPYWASTGKEYWQAVNEEEKGTQYREFEIALPKEFTNEQNIKLVQEFCQKIFNNNYTYSFGIHKNIGKLSREENPHAHIMFSERIIDRDRKVEPTKQEYFKQRRKDKQTGEYKNGYIKDRDINGANRKNWLEEKRKQWADIQNEHLKTNNITYDTKQEETLYNKVSYKTVTHKSLKEQGIQRLPQIHLNAKNVNLIIKNKTSKTIEKYKEIQQKNTTKK